VNPDDGPTPVLFGRTSDGLEWVVTASGDDERFVTMLSVSKDGKVVAHGGGMGGPKLYPGSVMNEYSGKSSGLPYFVMARVAPSIDRVVATTAQGAEVVLSLSRMFDEYGLRFAAASLPVGHEPASIRAEVAGVVVETFPPAGTPLWPGPP
jgi:hypothetical protein